MKPWTAVRPVAFSLAALSGAGCATAPQTHNALESARSTYRLAHADPEVQLRAPVELQLAERSLVQAERFWKDGADAGIVAHHAYLAEQRSRIAMKRAARGARHRGVPHRRAGLRPGIPGRLQRHADRPAAQPARRGADRAARARLVGRRHPPMIS